MKTEMPPDYHELTIYFGEQGQFCVPPFPTFSYLKMNLDELNRREADRPDPISASAASEGYRKRTGAGKPRTVEVLNPA